MSASQSNIPHIDLAAALEPDKLAAWLDYEYQEHRGNVASLMAGYERFLAATVAGIGGDDVAARAADFVKFFKAEQAATDATRTKIKAPVLHAQRLIDGEARKLTDKLANAADGVSAKITTYLREKEAVVRRAAEQEAARLELEAQAAMAAADAIGTPVAIDAAVEAVQEAQQAAAMATASAPELTRTRSQAGSLTGLKDDWKYRVVDLSKVPAAYLAVNDAMVRAAMKSSAKNMATLRIDGIEFYNDAKAFVR
jgi:hypothetical protein